MQQFDLNIFNILIISGVIQGIIFSAVVIGRKSYRASVALNLSFVVLFLSFSNLYYWLVDIGFVKKYTIIRYLFIPWQLLILPVFYTYVSRLTNKKITTHKRLLLFGPFVLVWTGHLLAVAYKLYVNVDYDFPDHFAKGLNMYVEFFALLFNLIVLLFSKKLIRSVETSGEISNYNEVIAETSWLHALISIGFAICMCWLVGIAFTSFTNVNYEYLFYPLWLSISILIYYIGYVGLQKSNMLSSRLDLRKKRLRKGVKMGVTPQKSPETYRKIIKYIEGQHCYLDPHYNLKKLSNSLQLSESHLSKVIHGNSELNFNDLINKYRVQDAKKMLRDEDFDMYTILAIGLEAGFNSKSSFYNAFKKFENSTPLIYKNKS